MSQSKYSIINIIPYFGSWPEWIELFLESCKFNPDVNWLIYTDCPPPENLTDNVKIISTSFADYKRDVSTKLGITFRPANPYKLCDLKPALGFIHADEISGYDFYAFGDIDVIYGNLRHFLDDEVLDRFDVIGTHELRLSGHFCLFRNNRRNREAFKKIKHWRNHLENPDHLSLDESKYSKVFLPHRRHPKWLRKLWSFSSRYQRRVYFKEQYTTILSPILWLDGTKEHPEIWTWKNGHLFNDRDHQEFMYLHFMNWKSNRWLPKQFRGQAASWSKLDKLVQFDWRDIDESGFQITRRGFTLPTQQTPEK